MLLNNNLIVCSAHLNEETENERNQGTVSKSPISLVLWVRVAPSVELPV